DCITSDATYHFTGRYPYLLCFHVSKSGYTYPPAGNPVIPGLYLTGIKPANLFRNYLIMANANPTCPLTRSLFVGRIYKDIYRL
ncbi:MAG TPA: hypothetical protein H9968_04950, partial [Candidatus Anaerobutyricum stercoris]|nr:hypothetical protein [Candidatus Anaerobutyricum stercoris]